MEPGSAAQDTGPRIDEHFDCIRANLIRCEECNENFFFDFLRHPRYFVTHFKTCHLKNVLYRFNGCSEEENQRVRFGPRRKKDATAWFGQLKSTEKRMISMQDNKWGEIVEHECWSCRLCKHARKTSDMPHAFEPNELGRRQALLHLRQFHEVAYNAFLSMLPAVGSSSSQQSSGNATSSRPAVGREQGSRSGQPTGSSGLQAAGNVAVGSMEQGRVHTISQPSTPRQSAEADRSRLRRMRATPDAKKAEAARSRRRREQLTPAQRQADAERRARKRQRVEERARSQVRRADASPEAREKEVKRSRDRRQNATEQQRKREAQRSRTRRQNATDEQRVRERERCRRRYEVQKQQRLLAQQDGSVADVDMPSGTPTTSISDTVTPPSNVSDHYMPPPRGRVMPADLERRNQQLLQQQAGLGLQIRSLYASLSCPPSQVDL
ncbi:hypothetical protein PHYPSEUDO_002388 [Phytophthora pseudosyringae]|uniref:Uncharacterized protein n=1 Tax=Phytophthora pseudosyringae TaxID=221518 RepID=A0A8T1VTN0_9STRA|nr:hypothetical protein PHYPSEUDO_002388 [Phytophthora pseudosyringae]